MSSSGDGRLPFFDMGSPSADSGSGLRRRRGWPVSTSAPVSVTSTASRRNTAPTPASHTYAVTANTDAGVETFVGGGLRQVGRDHRRIEAETETVRHRHRRQRLTRGVVCGEQIAGRSAGRHASISLLPQLIRATEQRVGTAERRRPATCGRPHPRSRRRAHRRRRPPGRPLRPAVAPTDAPRVVGRR